MRRAQLAVMYIDLVDALRCPRAHADSWLVAAAHETLDRCIVRGALGCPVCETEYPIVEGVARFGGPPAPGVPAPHRGDGERAAEGMRLAALLDLTGPGGIVALGGTWADAADAMLALADVRVLVVEPPDGQPWRVREPLGAVVGAPMPVAAGALRGAALDEATASPERLDAAVRALRGRGRLVAPAAAALPVGVRELARDDRHWVAEREPVATGPVVTLRRA